MFAVFRKMLFFSLVNGFTIVRVIAVVRGSELNSRYHITFVGLLLGLFPDATYCGSLNDMEIRH